MASIWDPIKTAINSVSSFLGLNKPNWPVKEGRITSAFGYRTDATPHQHRGIDIAPKVPGTTGVAVNAPAGGNVTYVGKSSGGSSEVQITLPNGEIVDLKHMTGLVVAKGDVVLGGEKVGAMGSDGPSTGVHVHLEMRPAGATNETQAFDPVPQLPSRPSSIQLTAAVHQQGNTIVNTNQ